MEIKVGKLPAAMSKELETFSSEVIEQINARGEALMRAGVKRLRAASPKRTGRYAKGWTVRRESAFGKPHSFTIYNKDKPGLAHLLEHGHAKRGGGRVAGRPHIAPVENEMVAGYMAIVEEVIRR